MKGLAWAKIRKSPRSWTIPTLDDFWFSIRRIPTHQWAIFPRMSRAVSLAGDAGTLIRMPQVSGSSNRVERGIKASSSGDGALTATLLESSFGQSAAAERSWFRSQSLPEYTKSMETWIMHGSRASTLSKVNPKGIFQEGRFDLDLEFNAAAYGQVMQGRLLMFNPAPVSRREGSAFVDPTRKYPNQSEGLLVFGNREYHTARRVSHR